jgi:hypothetical protein
METVKKPEMLLGLGNSVAIVGLAFYFHKQLNAIKTEMDELSEHLKSSVNKFVAVQNAIITREQLVETASALNTKIDETNAKLKNIGDDDELYFIQEALQDLVDELTEVKVEWDYPPRKGKKRRHKSQGKRHRRGKRNSYPSDISEGEESEDESDAEVERSVAQVVRKKKRSKRN